MRLGINIPSDLYKRMTPLKGSVNVSQICRLAIEAQVEAYERAGVMVEQADDVEDLVDRLTKTEIVVDWVGIGLSDGKAWIEAAQLEDVEHLVHVMEVIEKQGRPPTDVPPPGVPGVKDYSQHTSEHREWFMQQSDMSGGTNPYIEAERDYMRGWLAYVNVVREKIRIHNRASREARTRELFAIRPSPAKAELPRQLL